MRYLCLLLMLMLSSCNNDQVNTGWIIFDLTPLSNGRVVYHGKDENLNQFKSGRVIKFIGHEGDYNLGDSIKITKKENINQMHLQHGN